MKKNMYTKKIVWAIFFAVLQIYPSYCAVIQKINSSREVVTNGRPCVIEYYSPTCPHCQSIAPVYNQVARANTNGTQFYQIDIQDENPGINRIPTFMFIDSQGKKTIENDITSNNLGSKVANLR